MATLCLHLRFSLLSMFAFCIHSKQEITFCCPPPRSPAWIIHSLPLFLVSTWCSEARSWITTPLARTPHRGRSVDSKAIYCLFRVPFNRVHIHSVAIVGHWARDALLRRVSHHQRHPRRRRRPLLPQNVDGVDCVGPRPAHHLLGLVRFKLSWVT